MGGINSISSICSNCTKSEDQNENLPFANIKYTKDNKNVNVNNNFKMNSKAIKKNKGKEFCSNNSLTKIDLNNNTPAKSININNKYNIKIVKLDNNKTYIGEVLNNNLLIKHGYGIEKCKKLVYKGQFKNNLYNGLGIYIQYSLSNPNNTLTYKGEFLNSIKSGIGIQFSGDGTYVYEGEWKNNYKNGIGLEILPDKSKYQGQFVNGKKHGKGIYTMISGRKYQGEFKNGKIDGYGFLKDDSGDYYDGYWEDNSYNGFGILYKKGILFKGYFKNDNKFGYGIKTIIKENNNEKDNDVHINNNSKDLVLVGNWINSSLEGLALGINGKLDKVVKMFKFAENQIKYTISDEVKIHEKIKNSNDCVNLFKFYLKYK